MNTNKTQKYQQFSQAASGVQKDFPATSSVKLGGKSWTKQNLIQVFTAATAAFDAVENAKAQLKAAIEAQRAESAVGSGLYKQLRQWAENEWGKGSPVLADFGFKQAKPKVKSSETKALAAAKARQTRVVHGTHGTRQKKLLTASGSPGLVLVGPDGKPIPGFTQGPVPPAIPPGTVQK